MIIAFSNFKGGVGKTTSTINVGAALAKRGKRVLLIDLDAQHNLTQSLNIDNSGATIYGVLHSKHDLPTIEATNNLWVCPASLELVKAELELAAKFRRESILSNALNAVKANFDFILLDCPPSLGVLTVNAYVAADAIFVPIEAEYLALKGYAVLSEAVQGVGIEVDKVFVTKYDSRKVLNRTVKEHLLDSLGSVAFQTVIRTNVALAEAPTEGKDIFRYDSRSNGAADYEQLTKEILRWQRRK